MEHQKFAVCRRYPKRIDQIEINVSSPKNIYNINRLPVEFVQAHSGQELTLARSYISIERINRFSIIATCVSVDKFFISRAN